MESDAAIMHRSQVALFALNKKVQLVTGKGVTTMLVGEFCLARKRPEEKENTGQQLLTGVFFFLCWWKIVGLLLSGGAGHTIDGKGAGGRVRTAVAARETKAGCAAVGRDAAIPTGVKDAYRIAGLRDDAIPQVHDFLVAGE